MKLSIIVRFSFPGVHSWPDAPDGPEGYLRLPHRHMFHVEAVKSVKHQERDIEFIGLRNKMEVYCQSRFGAIATFSSCETMAIALTERFDLTSCKVLEDGENGALMERE